MNRRSFLTKLLAGAVAPMFLPGAGRLWVQNDKLQVVTHPFWFGDQIAQDIIAATLAVYTRTDTLWLPASLTPRQETKCGLENQWGTVSNINQWNC